MEREPHRRRDAEQAGRTVEGAGADQHHQRRTKKRKTTEQTTASSSSSCFDGVCGWGNDFCRGARRSSENGQERQAITPHKTHALTKRTQNTPDAPTFGYLGSCDVHLDSPPGCAKSSERPLSVRFIFIAHERGCIPAAHAGAGLRVLLFILAQQYVCSYSTLFRCLSALYQCRCATWPCGDEHAQHFVAAR
jgi:hypothetical protein